MEPSFAIAADRVFDGNRFHERAAALIEGDRVHGIVLQGDIPRGWSVRKMPTGTLLAPGFIDLQVNGGGGVLLNDAPTEESLRAIARAHRHFGTTGCLPTLITDTRDKTQAAITAATRVAGTGGVLGLHLEGPFISPSRPGIHPPDRIASARLADLDWLEALSDAGASLVTLAPECVPDGFVRGLADFGVRVSAGHSEASAEIMRRAIGDGLSGVTHLHNAMPPMTAREPGMVGLALSDPYLTAGLIVDGLHVDPLVVRATFAAKGAARIALVTDAMPTVGTALDRFQLLGRTIRLVGRTLTSEAGTLAGAHLDMASAVRTTVAAGIAIEDALHAATLTPARFLGLEEERGILRAGARADMVALSADLDVLATWIGGNENSVDS